MRNDQPSEQIILPALRGIMGDWVYYSCLVDLPTLAARVNYAAEIHNSKNLSDMIQRQLSLQRSKQIAEYLQTQPDRLFNALVVATYDGQPNWHALSNVRSKTDAEELEHLPDSTVSSVGFLTLRGDERLFALDGQHRLSGIKRAVQEGVRTDPMDKVPVLFVAHQQTQEGLRRTRRLFTTLNKKARPVSKFDIIALDEDDVMALSVRWLVDHNPDLFDDDRIAFVASNNMPSTNVTSLTTIVNLYDILLTWFTKAHTPLRIPPSKLRKTRPDDDQLADYYQRARRLFEELRDGFPELEAFFSAHDTEPIVREYRDQSPLFRPVGLRIFVTIVARLTEEMGVSAAVEEAAKLPRSLDASPFTRLMWDPNNQTIRRFKTLTLRELLLHMLGRSQLGKSELLSRYRKEVGDDSLELPERVT